MPKQKIEVVSKEGLRLSAIHYTAIPKNSEMIIISGATGVKKEFYTDYAEFLFENGFDVIMYDYRGTGESATKLSTDANHRMHEWGELDMETIISWGKNQYDKLHLTCHSIGGQVFPFTNSHHEISSAIFIASQNLYHGHWSGFERVKVLLFWYIILPALVGIFGYLPYWVLGGGSNLPKNIALDWKMYGTNKHGIIMDKPQRRKAYQSVKSKIKFISLDDDHTLAPKCAVYQLVMDYGRSPEEHWHIVPSDYQLDYIGHFGFFRPKVGRAKLWNEVLAHYQ